MAPQWGSNSKGYAEGEEEGLYWCFSPRNGEVILKQHIQPGTYLELEFQSPQWGSNSKVEVKVLKFTRKAFQSPQWGSNSKVFAQVLQKRNSMFQSPQWGSNSKGKNNRRVN